MKRELNKKQLNSAIGAICEKKSIKRRRAYKRRIKEVAKPYAEIK